MLTRKFLIRIEMAIVGLELAARRLWPILLTAAIAGIVAGLLVGRAIR